MPPSRRRRLARALLALALLGLAALVGGAAWLAGRRAGCADGPDEGPRAEGRVAWGPGGLWAGAARVALGPALPATVAGYGPPRPEAREEAAPLAARALVLAAGARDAPRVGLVTLDLLLVPPALAERVRDGARARGLGEVHVLATHTHSSFGGYDPRAVAQVAGTGAFEAGRLTAVAEAALAALALAAGRLAPVALEVGEGAAPELVRNRSGGEPPPGRLTRVRWVGADGPVAELVVLAAHPTLVPRATRALDPDWPGRLAQARETAGRAPVVLVLQGEVGDASARGAEGGPAAYAARVAERLDGVALTPVARPALALGRASVGLPRADASRLVPAPVAPLAEGALCATSEARAEVALLALGPVRLLLVPGEPTQAAAGTLAAAAGGARVVSLAGGYVGYVEGRARAEAGEGEARRQYFAPQLVERLAEAARVASVAAAAAR